MQKTIIITGANSGIGYVTALELAKSDAEIIFAGRSEERNAAAIQEVKAATGNKNLHFMSLDLNSLESVSDFASEWAKTGKSIDILINNAGLAGQRGITKDGFEIHFGVNHLGHFLLTHLLLPHIKEHAGARIVHVASRAHTRVKTIQLEHVQKVTRTVSGFPEYCESKLANVCFNRSLAPLVKNRGIHTYSLHPGVVASNIWTRLPGPIESIAKLFMISNEEGAKTTLYCATSSACAGDNGLYYDKSKPVAVAKHVTQPLQDELWEKSMEWCNL